MVKGGVHVRLHQGLANGPRQGPAQPRQLAGQRGRYNRAGDALTDLEESGEAEARVGEWLAAAGKMDRALAGRASTNLSAVFPRGSAALRKLWLRLKAGLPPQGAAVLGTREENLFQLPASYRCVRKSAREQRD